MDCRNNIFTYVVLEIKSLKSSGIRGVIFVQHTPVGAKIEIKRNTLIKDF